MMTKRDAGPVLASHYYHYARQEILDLVPLDARRVLDIGCGAGRLGHAIKLRQDAQVHGIEMVPAAATQATEVLDHVWACPVEEALDEVADCGYDCIVAADVLEHLQDPWGTLARIRTKLGTGGKLVASIPNVMNWMVLSDLLEGRFEYQTEGILDRTHLRFFTRKSVEELFWSAGFHIKHLGTTRRGLSPTHHILDAMEKEGLSGDRLRQDGNTFQFLVEAEIPETDPHPKVAVIVLNWNGKKDTMECLESVLSIDYPNFEVIVVDNGSTDGSQATIRERFPAVALIETGLNLGYAGGNNVGIRRALSDINTKYVLILNNDLTVDKHLITNLVGAAILDPKIGLAGPINYYFDEPDKIWASYARQRRVGIPGHNLSTNDICTPCRHGIMQVDALVGSAIMIKRPVFETIGLLDEDFFLCYEEFDFAMRARNAGYKIIACSAAAVWHKIGQALGADESPMRTYFNTRNRLLWAKKHLDRRQRSVLLRNNISAILKTIPPLKLSTTGHKNPMKGLVWSINTWIRQTKRNMENPGNLARFHAVKDYVFSNFGDCPNKIRTLQRT
ncbi:MAG TPA: glycosyltransferase [Thiobacillaceae bacterium]|nr:glycosyltransferase [Thiobacillaceae bacterium]HNU64283.1 glycosyltransferase [Thiobacillaceae bacterium]